ncbi:MAG: protoheme IX farnesyltransferase [Candidatus Wallbacteria bacterium]|nr:protoheme IX farnesyltransferase [Candidatus Wallbacteria bacterium]
MCHPPSSSSSSRRERTRTRPIPSGRLQPLESAVFGGVVTAAGMFLLLAGTNMLTSALGLVAVVSYLFVYTPLKRTTGLCTIAGALPGALPPAMGWTAASGQIEPGTWVLFSILFLWQLPHFLSIAWMRRDDYARGGFAMLTVIDPEGGSAGRQAVLHCLALLPVSLLPSVLGLAGASYFVAAFVLGLGYTVGAARLAWLRTTEAARGMFLASLVYLPVLLTVLMLDRVPR